MRNYLKIVLIYLALFGPARAEKLALAIGVDRYDHLLRLQKAAGDAHTIAEEFRSAGYRTTQIGDLHREAFWQEWSFFLDQIKPGDEVAFFFAGHGIEIGGLNYLLLADVPKSVMGERVIRENAIQVSQLLAELRERTPRVSLVILDACRNNPYAATGRRGVGGTRGLARLEPPEGSFVMYSAGVGEEALDRLADDDQEPVSVYMRKLLPLLRSPGLRIQDVALRVREDVRTIAASVPHTQNPAYYDELRGLFCFAGCAGSNVTAASAIAPRGAAPSESPTLAEECRSANPTLSCLWKDQ
jgi:hypothetical protein